MLKKYQSLKRNLQLSTAAVLLSVFAASANAIPITFNSITEQLVLSDATSFVNSSFSFEMQNSTGVEWTAFQVRLTGANQFGSYDFMRIVDYNGAGTPTYLDENNDALGFFETLTIEGISIANGASFDFNISILGGAAPEGMESYSVFAIPSINSGGSVPVPVPATLVLFVLGLAGLGWTRRMKM